MVITLYYYDNVICSSNVDKVQFDYSGHQGRAQSDHHRPQVSVPLISQPMVSYRNGGTTPLQEVRLHALWPSQFFLLSRDKLTLCMYVSHVYLVCLQLAAHTSYSYQYVGGTGVCRKIARSQYYSTVLSCYYANMFLLDLFIIPFVSSYTRI